jgi:hypothetical protein
MIAEPNKQPTGLGVELGTSVSKPVQIDRLPGGFVLKGAESFAYDFLRSR